jgi:signal transduction histidine kinase
MRERSDLWHRIDALWQDLGLTGMVLCIPLISYLVTGTPQHLLDIALILPLVLRRRAPVLTFTVICLLLLGQAMLFSTPRYGDVALLIALHAVAAYGPLWAVWASLGTGILGAAIAGVRWADAIQDAGEVIGYFVPLTALVLAAWMLGYLARTRRAYVAGLEERAAQLERDAAQQAQIATAAERARIAREMHDVVAHSLSVMVVQADGALYAAPKHPEVALETLRTISETGRSSLTEMRKLLGVLRDDRGELPMGPAPRGADIPQLVDQLRGSGLTIELNVLGALDRLDPATGLTTYRIVQEALTNTLKHAGPDVTATVDLRVTTDSVRIQVDDDGRGGSAVDDGQGHGILGIRERIAMHDGLVDAGPRPGGGFRIKAVVPVAKA